MMTLRDGNNIEPGKEQELSRGKEKRSIFNSNEGCRFFVNRVVMTKILRRWKESSFVSHKYRLEEVKKFPLILFSELRKYLTT